MGEREVHAVAACHARLAPTRAPLPGQLAGEQGRCLGGSGPSKCCPVSVLMPSLASTRQELSDATFWAQFGPENAILLQARVLQQGAPSPPSPPFLPFLSLSPPSLPPFSSLLACLHACPRGFMEQQGAPVHEAWPELQVGTCKRLHPPGHLHGTVAGGIVGQLPRPELRAPVVGAGIES